MLVLETVLKIRREFASGKAFKAIARDLRLSRKVVRKAIREPDAEFAYRRAVQPLPRLAPFKARLDELLEEDVARPRREKLRMTRVHVGRVVYGVSARGDSRLRGWRTLGTEPTGMNAAALFASGPLDTQCDAHAAADTQGGQALLAARPLQLVEQGGQDARARGADRVTDGDGAAVDVDPGRVEA